MQRRSLPQPSLSRYASIMYRQRTLSPHGQEVWQVLHNLLNFGKANWNWSAKLDFAMRFVYWYGEDERAGCFTDCGAMLPVNIVSTTVEQQIAINASHFQCSTPKRPVKRYMH